MGGCAGVSVTMDFTFTPEQEAFRQEVRGFSQREVIAKGLDKPTGTEQHDAGFYRALAEHGYIGMQWPRSHGGQGRSHVDMSIFYEEMAYANAPLGRYTGSVVFVGESLIAYGSPEQQREYLPRIASGEITCCWCLSEPGSGSDAASLITRAEALPGGGFRLHGQKIFTSGAHLAEVGLVAARTNPDAPKHHGISLFLISMKLPGISVQPLWTIGGWHVNQVFFDSVELPASALVGKKDEGWRNILITLNLERSAIGKVGLLMRIFDKIRDYATEHEVAESMRERLFDLRAEIEALRWMSYRVARLQDQGHVPDALVSMSKLRASELMVAISDLGMDVLGARGAERGADAPLAGEAEYLYRNTQFHLAGGGTPDIQRMVIAQRGLGLPRS
ncbi:MAG TPA: acyl-CoA dehydrogenase family protein [Chloroflexota bacterium]|nr:acyl-CoA dehydrogenase family protein [Chloroflexota bacterium]